MRERKYNILELQQERLEWKTVYCDSLDADKRQVYLNRKKAVDMYIDGFKLNEITAQTGIFQQNIRGLVEKCIKINPSTSKPYGYSGLIQQKKTSDNVISITQHSRTVSTKGSFRALLYAHPSLIKFIEDNYFGKNNATLEKKISKSNLHKKFLKECRNLNIQDYEYPFNTVDKAKRTFYNYLDKISAEKANDTIRRESKNAQQKYYSTGLGERNRTYPIIPFSTVQVDGHKLDIIYTVEVKNKYGEIILMPAMRMWLIAVIDVATRTILGYSLTSNENYNQTDILKALKNAMMPKQTMNFTIGGFQYPENYGFHSLAIKETEWAMIDTIMLDNAKSHLAKNVIQKLSEILHCSLNYGSVATPETRGIIERVFGTLEEQGFHRLPATTGSNPQDTRRDKAEQNAVKYQITYNDIEQLVEYFIALYNNAPHSSLDNETPLECMQRRIQSGLCPHIANIDEKEKINSLTYIREQKTIRGNVKNGKRPYITYKGVKYRNDILAQSMGLLGKTLHIEINPDNIRTIKAYFEDGTELGWLVATGEWGRKDHSLKTREDALRLANANKRKNEPSFAPLTELENEFNNRAEVSMRDRTKADKIRKEQNRTLQSDLKKKKAEITPINQEDLQSVSNATEADNESGEKNKNDKPYTLEQLEEIFKTQSFKNI